MRIKKISSTSVLKGNIIDGLESNSTTNAPSIAAVKRECLTYQDNNFPYKPSGFTIVRSLPEYQEPGIIYFVCPLPYVNFRINLTNYMGDEWVDDAKNVIIYYDKNSTKETISSDIISIPYCTGSSGGVNSQSLEKDPISESINLGLRCTSTLLYDVSFDATFEQRNKSTTALEKYGSLSSIVDGLKHYIEENGEIANLNISTESSYLVNITITLNSGSACLKGNSLIKTKEGSKMIKDIQVGDIVIDKENKEVLVTKIYSHNVDFITRIYLSNGAKVETSLYHKFETDWGIVKSVNLVKDIKLKCGNGSDFKIVKSENIKTDLETVYEIMTETGSYQLENGIINICEDI